MYKYDVRNWPENKDLDGMLYFAQLLLEQTDTHTIDSYRARSLNTHLRSIELYHLAEDYADSKLKRGRLEAPVAEMKSSIKLDEALNVDQKDSLGHILQLIESEYQNPEIILSLTKVLKNTIEPHYFNSVKSQLKLAVMSVREKNKIQSLTSAFITELELQGYPKPSIAEACNKCFFDMEISPDTSVACRVMDMFFDVFTCVDQEYDVCFISKNWRHINRSLATNFQLEILLDKPEWVQLSKAGKAKDRYLVIKNIAAKNSLKARKEASMRVASFADANNFLNHYSQLRWDPNGFVFCHKTKRSTQEFRSKNPMICGNPNLCIKSLGDIKKNLFTEKLLRLDEHSKKAVGNVFKYHRVASESFSVESKMVSLWSALEGFLPLPPANNVDRGEFYCKCTVPWLSVTYVEKLLMHLLYSLKQSGIGIVNLLNSIHLDGSLKYSESQLFKLAAVVSTKELEGQRRTLYELLDRERNILLINRVFSLHEILSNSSNLKKHIFDHDLRVRQHLLRIYTSRNQIVHDATALSYLPSLVENLHNYVDTIVGGVIRFASRCTYEVTIMDAMNKAAIAHGTWLKRLESKTTADLTNLDSLFGWTDEVSRPNLQSTNKASVKAPLHSGVQGELSLRI